MSNSIENYPGNQIMKRLFNDFAEKPFYQFCQRIDVLKSVYFLQLSAG